jgi:hypothetical protein
MRHFCLHTMYLPIPTTMRGARRIEIGNHSFQLPRSSRSGHIGTSPTRNIHPSINSLLNLRPHDPKADALITRPTVPVYGANMQFRICLIHIRTSRIPGVSYTDLSTWYVYSTNSSRTIPYVSKIRARFFPYISIFSQWRENVLKKKKIKVFFFNNTGFIFILWHFI